MTSLTKTVARRSIQAHRGRRTVVTLEPGDLIGFREEGRRTTYYLPLSACFDLAVKVEVAHQRALKKKVRKA